jgi:hypothetical protein
LLNKELHNLLYLLNIVRVITSTRLRWAGHVARDERNVYTILVVKAEGKEKLGRPRLRWSVF